MQSHQIVPTHKLLTQSDNFLFFKKGPHYTSRIIISKKAPELHKPQIKPFLDIFYCSILKYILGENQM